MKWRDLWYYVCYYKNWIISGLIFTVLFWISVFLSYVGSLHLLQSDRPLLTFLAESISYTLFIYMVATLAGIVLVSLVKLIGFFRKKDIEVLLEVKTQFLKEEIEQTEARLAKNERILHELPVGILITQGHKIVYVNDWMQHFFGWEDKLPLNEGTHIFQPEKDFTALEKRVILGLMHQKKVMSQISLENAVGHKNLLQVSAYGIKPKDPKKGIVWFFQDAALEMKNIELETYYQTVFRAMTILHVAEENNTPEEEILKQLLDEVIGIYGIKTGFYLRYTDKKLDCVFSAGEDKYFPDRPMNMDLSDKEVRETAAAKAVLNKRGYVYDDLTHIPYYQKYFTRENRKMIKSTFAYPMIVNGKVEGVISLYGYENNAFTDSLLFRIEQLNAEICKNLSNIRARRKAREAIHQYEECLRTQIHELETNKKIMQRQASEVNAMIGDLILARDAAEKANRSKTEFLANISHELRTPLNAILGFSEAIENETFGPLENKQYKDYIGYISTSGKHLLSLINDVLDLSCVEVGRHKMNEEEIKIIPMIQDVVSVIARYPGGDKRHITLTPKKSDMVLLADVRSFKQILLNVLSNAVKFTPEKGKIKINVSITPKKELMISVADNGVGIPKDKINDLFQPFSQVENIMTREHEGSGLGLVLIRKLIELHGGRVWIESDEGQGTTVFLVFPKSRIVNEHKKGKGKE